MSCRKEHPRNGRCTVSCPCTSSLWQVHRKTGGVGVDVILALDLDLGPEDGGEAADQGLAKSFCRWSNRSKSSSFVVQEKVLDATSDMDAACVAWSLRHKYAYTCMWQIELSRFLRRSQNHQTSKI